MAKHLLIAIATSKNPKLTEVDQRPQLSGVLKSVVNLFTGTLRRYRRELVEVAENPKSGKLRDRLDRWFQAEERDRSDWVVLYYTGHANVVDGKLYLLTSDFEPNLYSSTAFNLGELSTMVAAERGFRQPRRVLNLLVIVDTCFAGAGTPELASHFAEVAGQVAGGTFYLLGTALSLEEADAGAFAKALIEVIDDYSKRNVTQEYLGLEQIAPLVNRRLDPHRTVLKLVTTSLESPRFFPNPSYMDTGGRAVPADQAQRAISSAEFRDHWWPRSRGVEFDSQPGAYFSGRETVLAKLTAFLDSQGDNRTRIVTGRPGAGKSAILSRIVARSLDQQPDAGHQKFPHIDLALHAKGKTLEDVKARLSAALGVEPKTEAILDSLRHAQATKLIVLDALDEAAQPVAIAEQLLVPMSRLPHVKLVVGTRATYLGALGDAEAIDIDRPEYADKADIARYVEARLRRRDEPGEPTPYSGRDSTAAQVAAIVANHAYPNFLVARLAAEDLLTRPRAANPNAPKEMAFPTKVEAAFDAYLARFGPRETAVRDILRPLAYAEGQGLPWDNIWAPLASTLSGRAYTDDDIRWVLQEAGSFILESAELGRSVYRLYHEALADDTWQHARPGARAHTCSPATNREQFPRSAVGRTG